MGLLTRKNCLLALVLAQCAVYFQAVGFPWIHLDDYQHIFENPLILQPSFSHLWEFWKAPFFTLYIPVTYTTWFSLGLVSLSPWLFHLANIAFHIVNAILVFLILAELFEDDVYALGGALFFAIHPIQAEAVTWISGLKDCLFGFFYLLAVHLYVLRLKGKRQTKNYVFLWLFVLAYFSKPMAITLPFVLLCFRRFYSKESWATSIKALSVLLILILPFSLLAKSVQPDIQVKDLSPLWFRPVIALHSLGFYLKQALIPTGFFLDYGKKPTWVLNHIVRDLYLLVFVLALGFGVYQFRKHKIVLLGVALVVLPVLPVLGVVPFQFQLFSTVADRYFYLSMMGLSVLVAFFLSKLSRNLLAVPFLTLLLLAGMGFLQVNKWQSNESIFEHSLQHNTNSFLAHNNLAYLYFQKEQYQRAARHLERAVQLHPEETGLRINYISALVKSGRQEEAISVAKEVLRKEPNHPQALKALQTLQPKG